MQFFIDSADIREIEQALAMGLCDGVTTNPSLVSKTGRSLDEVLKEIVPVVPGPVSAEVRNPLTDAGLKKFLADWEKVPKARKAQVSAAVARRPPRPDAPPGRAARSRPAGRPPPPLRARVGPTPAPAR